MRPGAIKHAFTLIELLVVIAIIAVLSAVVLVSLNSARAKGSDAAIKQNMQALRSRSEVFGSENDYTYARGSGITASVACPNSLPTNTANDYSVMGDETFFRAVSAAREASGGLCAYTTGTNNWAVIMQLKSSASSAWCVDSSGRAKKTSGGNLQSAGAYTQSTLNADISSAGCGN